MVRRERNKPKCLSIDKSLTSSRLSVSIPHSLGKIHFTPAAAAASINLREISEEARPFKVMMRASWPLRAEVNVEG